MHTDARIYVAGHRGLVGSAIVRQLRAAGQHNLLLRTHAELDLTDAAATREFFALEKPEHVFLAAARVGGIQANQQFPADFVRDNLLIQTNVIHEAWRTGVQRLLFLGSSCIYPRLAPQPMRESDLLTGPLEPTNRPYALAKIAGIEMCWSYNRQHGTRFLAAMPTNLYGPGDNHDLDTSHVIPALLRKFHEARVQGKPSVTVWGSGEPRREFMYSDDMAAACVFLMNLPERSFDSLLGSDEALTGRFEPPLINIGVGEDLSIRELAETIRQVTGYQGDIVFDRSKPDGTPRKLMDVSCLNALGFQPTVSLREGLRRALADVPYAQAQVSLA
ncbi:GDP-fucose synthetase [Hydrogenophaga sp. Root209]|uniref:GDP-L-fucose synthase family protein n=1 Tax=Hydrogenophaga sp. Root209 TaxID=1736490 RepID=UPI0006FDF670|nr:GDP-L-fucose synthase [Hydrogenophaga sp. Root209]KRB96952.1 GDP-fucose synthetase [Hydrogenophaga sp. Root209]